MLKAPPHELPHVYPALSVQPGTQVPPQTPAKKEGCALTLGDSPIFVSVAVRELLTTEVALEPMEGVNDSTEERIDETETEAEGNEAKDEVVVELAVTEIGAVVLVVKVSDAVVVAGGEDVDDKIALKVVAVVDVALREKVSETDANAYADTSDE